MSDGTPRAVTPRIMGIVNASLDSVVGGVEADGAGALALSMVASGASVIDVGGQSLRTDQPEVPVATELARVEPVLAAVRAACPGATISVDTYRAPVAEAAIAAGATLVNDPSGLRDPELADVVAAHGVDVVLTYNRGTPKVRLARGQLVEDPVADCRQFLARRLEALAAAGVPAGRVILDLGPDLGKAPEQTISVLHHAAETRDALGSHRLLWALSKKDFIGALLGRRPALRVAGTFGALAAVEFREGDLVRVHDVAGVADFFAVRAAIRNGHEGHLELPPDLRYDR
jgi:dihydropteroate synthase